MNVTPSTSIVCGGTTAYSSPVAVYVVSDLSPVIVVIAFATTTLSFTTTSDARKISLISTYLTITVPFLSFSASSTFPLNSGTSSFGGNAGINESTSSAY